MATMKRRVIYVSDEDWQAWQSDAEQAKQSLSQWIRECVGFASEERYMPSTSKRVRMSVPEYFEARKAAEREWPADPDLGFNSRPFTPVPKTRK